MKVTGFNWIVLYSNYSTYQSYTYIYLIQTYEYLKLFVIYKNVD